jgi:hypothetical protein
LQLVIEADEQHERITFINIYEQNLAAKVSRKVFPCFLKICFLTLNDFLDLTEFAMVSIGEGCEKSA